MTFSSQASVNNDRNNELRNGTRSPYTTTSPSGQQPQERQLKSASYSVLGDEGRGGVGGEEFDEDRSGAYCMAHREQWLALRVQGGARSWPKLPNCFPSTS